MGVTMKHPKKANESKTEKKIETDNTMKYVVGVIVAILVIVILVMVFRKGMMPETPAAQNQPVQKTEDVAKTADPSETVFPKAKVAIEQSTQPSIINYCDRTKFYSIGYKPCSCNLKDNILKIELKNTGKVDIDKIWFQVTGMNGKMSYLAVDKAMKSQETEDFKINLAETEKSLGATVEDIVALPGLSVDGKDNVCLNQRLLLIKNTNCLSQCTSDSPTVQVVSE